MFYNAKGVFRNKPANVGYDQLSANILYMKMSRTQTTLLMYQGTPIIATGVHSTVYSLKPFNKTPTKYTFSES
jgi:hypothetical protein